LEVKSLFGELVGEFSGKNTVNRVLPDGKTELTNQGVGKILGMDAFMMSTAVTMVVNGVYLSEVNTIITTSDGSSVFLKGNAVSWASEKGGVTRAASIQTSQSEKFMGLAKKVLLHEYETDMMNNWVGKIWEWK
jgi:hypothetical protein